MRIGYARVSTGEQNLEAQVDALKKAGCDRVVSEKVSTRKEERKKLREALSWLREGDSLVCTKMDRLARSMRDLILITDRIDKQKADVVFLDQRIDTSQDEIGGSGSKNAHPIGRIDAIAAANPEMKDKGVTTNDHAQDRISNHDV